LNLASPDRRPGVLRRIRGLAVNVTPLRESRDFRFLLGGQAVNLVGNQVRMVTVPYLVFIITNHSSLAVGLVSLAQFFPQSSAQSLAAILRTSSTAAGC